MAEKLADRVVEQMAWLDPIADVTQDTINKTVQANAPQGQMVKDALHGVWLGHPLHPALVSVPLGAWTATLLLDLTGAEDGADLALGLGIAGAAGAALAGVADWNDTSGSERRIGLLHGLLNTTALTLNVTSLIMRRRGARTPGVALSTLGYAIGSAAAFLGGELSYVKGVGVSHTAWDNAPTEFTAALDADALKEGKPVRGQAGGVAVMLLKRGSEILALDATCPHAGGPLDEGKVVEDSIICPWHGSQFCMLDGSVEHGPATTPAIRFEARIREGKVEVRRAD